MLVEHARNLCGIADATHAEYDRPGTQIISLLACSLADMSINIRLTSPSLTHNLYGTSTATERTTCNYGLNPEFAHIANDHGLRITATDDTSEVRAIERTDHPFFVGTLFQPQLTTSPQAPHPIWLGFVDALARTVD